MNDIWHDSSIFFDIPSKVKVAWSKFIKDQRSTEIVKMYIKVISIKLPSPSKIEIRDRELLKWFYFRLVMKQFARSFFFSFSFFHSCRMVIAREMDPCAHRREVSLEKRWKKRWTRETSEFDSVTIESNGPENIQVSRFILSSFEISRRKFVFFSAITRVSSFQINLSPLVNSTPFSLLLLENRLLLFCNEV